MLRQSTSHLSDYFLNSSQENLGKLAVIYTVIDLWVAVTQNFEDKEDFESIQMFMIGCHFSS